MLFSSFQYILHLFTSITFYLKYISLSIQVHAYLFQPRFLHLCLFCAYPPIFVSISCLSQLNLHLSTCFNFHLFSILHNCFLSLVFLNLQISLSIPFFQSQPISRILTYIFFYLLANPNLRLYLSMLFSSFKSILHLFTSITFYLKYISLSIQVHAYLFQPRFLHLCLFFAYPPIFVSISCLSQPNLHLSTCFYFHLFSIHHNRLLSLVYLNL